MLVHDIVTDLLLRWERNPSLSPEDVCREYVTSPDFPAILAAVRVGIDQLRAADAFLANPNDHGKELSSGNDSKSGPIDDTVHDLGSSLANSKTADAQTDMRALPIVPGYQLLEELG